MLRVIGDDRTRSILYEALPEDQLDESLELLPAAFALEALSVAEPFPDLLDIQPEILSSWLSSLEIHADPRHDKCTFWYCPEGFELRPKIAPDSRWTEQQPLPA